MENTIHDVRGHLLNHIILYFLLINSFNSKKRLTSLAWIIVISATTFSITGMFYYYTIMDNPIETIRFGHLLFDSVNVSTELPVNFIGTLTIFAILICLNFFFQESRFDRRVTIITCTIPLLVATLLTQSKGSFVSLVIASTILLLLKAKKIALFFLIAMVLIGIFTPLKTESLKQRLAINYVTYEVIKDHPILGIGFGMQTFINNIDKESYMNRVPEKYRPEEIYTPHNLLLDITVRLGLIGLILFFSIIFVFGKMCRETIRKTRDDDIKEWGRFTVISFVAYFTIGMAEPVFLFSASATVFYIILAIITILWRLNQEERVIHDQPDTANNTNN
ncbi:MAG: O-antigen ligase family protein [Deltaproteobacteria bacterium]|nr:O-antigen ligase family protein [Deltaproteobacteria bacterium]